MASVLIEKKNSEEVIKYYIDDKLKKNFDERIIPSLNEQDEDCIFVIDGNEGSGKSTLALQIGKYIDNTLDISRVVFDAESFKQAIFKAKKGQCIIYDEAFTGLSSRTSLSGINTALVSLMMQMRQKNLLVILVLPTFFLLDKYAALFRTKALIHVYKNKGIRGYWRLYNRNKKKLLYILGKKTYSYGSRKTGRFINTRFKGRFYGVFALGSKDEENKYRKKKAKALEETQKNPMSAGQLKYKEQRDKILFLLRKETKKTYQEIEDMLLDLDLDLSYVQIRNVCIKFGDSEGLELKKEKLELKRELVKVKKEKEAAEKNIIKTDEILVKE